MAAAAPLSRWRRTPAGTAPPSRRTPGHAQDGGAGRPRGRWGCGEPRKPGHGSAGRTVRRPGRRGARPGRGRFERCPGEAAAAAGPRGRRHVPLWRGEPGWEGALLPPRPLGGPLTGAVAGLVLCRRLPGLGLGGGERGFPLRDGGEARGAGAGPAGREGAQMAAVVPAAPLPAGPGPGCPAGWGGPGEPVPEAACRRLTGLGTGAEIALPRGASVGVLQGL